MSRRRLRYLLERVEELEVALKRIYRDADDGSLYPQIALNNIAYMVDRVLAGRHQSASDVKPTSRLVTELEVEAQCSTCGGKPHASGRPCVCGDTNRAYREAQGLRELLYDSERRVGRLEAALRQIIEARVTYRLDPLEHALTAVSEPREVAARALAEKEGAN